MQELTQSRICMWREQALEQQHSKPGKRRRSRPADPDQKITDVYERPGAVEEETDAYCEDDEDGESDFEL